MEVEQGEGGTVITQPIIKTEGIKYVYPGEAGEALALAGVDLTVDQGEYLAVIGPNGSGKTTLLKHLNALLIPAAGRVLVNGLDTAIEDNLPVIRAQCGMIFQNPDNQLVATTVEEDVAFGLENMAESPVQIRARVAEALKTVGLEKLAQHPPHLLSGGEKQRVAVAGILAMRPRCLLMDEPTAMLDPESRAGVLDTVRSLNRSQGITVIHVTHFPEEAALADRVLVLDRGKMIKDGSSREILTDLSLLHSLGLQGTVAAELAAGLAKDGFTPPPGLLHGRELVEYLCSSALKS
ncbi:MAG: energy-coupling factor transporter ATPase [Bacillota bacterium]